MEVSKPDAQIVSLQEKLAQREALFDSEARKRGFDPAQAGNMALPGSLAKLFADCEEIRSELAEVVGNSTGSDEERD